MGLKESQELHIKGFKLYPVCRPMSNNGRFYGGILVLVKLDILQGITLIPGGKETEICTLKLCRHFFMLEKDLYLIFPYVNPYSSQYNTGPDIMQRVELLVSNCLKKGNCLLM